MSDRTTSSKPRLSAAASWAALVLMTLVLTALLFAAGEAAVRARQYLRTGTTASYEELYRFGEALNLRVLVAGVKTESFPTRYEPGARRVIPTRNEPGEGCLRTVMSG